MTSGEIIVDVTHYGTRVRTAYGTTLAWCPVVITASPHGIDAQQAEANARVIADALRKARGEVQP